MILALLLPGTHGNPPPVPNEDFSLASFLSCLSTAPQGSWWTEDSEKLL